jgi:hypothetical protein
MSAEVSDEDIRLHRGSSVCPRLRACAYEKSAKLVFKRPPEFLGSSYHSFRTLMVWLVQTACEPSNAACDCGEGMKCTVEKETAFDSSAARSHSKLALIIANI